MASYSVEDLKIQLELCLSFLNEFRFLSDSYIIEFFVKNHWEKLPSSWQKIFDEVKPPDLADQLLQTGTPDRGCKTVLPLSLLCFKRCSNLLAIPRTCDDKINEFNAEDFPDLSDCTNKLLQHAYRKHVNPKKQHEIRALSKIIAKTYSDARCTSIVDMGSGRGHLSRLLSLGYRFPVSAFEREGSLLKTAKIFDEEAKLHIKKLNNKHDLSGDLCTSQLLAPTHVQYTLSPNIKQCQFEELLYNLHRSKEKSAHISDKFLLTGLHACGDLSATMIRLFNETPSIKALVSVSCCYMKLTTDYHEPTEVPPQSSLNNRIYYPMSTYVKTLDRHHLPYKSRELACHALEDYTDRLKENGTHLRMHCYRAVLEVLIRRAHRDLIRPGVQTIKKAYNLTFSDYAEKAFKKLSLPLPDVNTVDIDAMLAKWHHVVTFFTLSLMTAPVVESVILLDRLLYCKENGLQCTLESIFEPILSPRCFAIIATKGNTSIK